VDTPVPEDQRGRIDAERSGFLDANNIRTVFWNYGMVGDYPRDPGNVDLSVFHSVEVPRGSGMNYSDGITPFVLAKVRTESGRETHIMETGFRERQTTSPQFNRIMRFEPRPGYFQPSPILNPGRSPAISNDPRTWPDIWPDRLKDVDDPGWPGSWNGFFGKKIVADQETYMVLDDNFYDAWDFFPDSRDRTRRGLGLRIEARGMAWANPQARNVTFWIYEITNEGTTDFDDNIIFGLYMDSGVGGSGLSCDGIFESDDDNAFFDRQFNEDILNLVYTWDKGGHGNDLSGPCGDTGYLGYAYLETPGNPFDGVDNDLDGVVDELRDGGPGQKILGREAIEAYIEANYDRGRFESTYGPLADRPPYRIGEWWTGDEDMDWVAELHDVGADGLEETGDEGEGDGKPTFGEPNFDKTDLNESDQIGLTGFKLNRIRPGEGNPDQEVDDILFFTNAANWPERLYNQFSSADSSERFDELLAANYNIGFLFASGPFSLKAGQSERFSLALAYGADLNELRGTVRTVQKIFDANYRFAVPPTLPKVTAEVGDGFVSLSWSDISERTADPVTGEFDFEGYRIYRSTEPLFLDPKTITTGSGSGTIGNGRPIAQFDLEDGISGFSDQTVEGVAYFLGTDSGITHTWMDTTVTNGQQYYYAVTSYDFGSERFEFFPSENAIAVSRTPRGGVVLPDNVVEVRPNPRTLGFVRAEVEEAEHLAGRGSGSVTVDVWNSTLVPDDHLMKITFETDGADEVRATRYSLVDSTTGETLFKSGTSMDGTGVGPVGAGLLPIIQTQQRVEVDTDGSGFSGSSSTNAVFATEYQPAESINRIRPGFPEDLRIVFSDTVVDTSVASFPLQPTPARFRVMARTAGGDVFLDFRFRDLDGDGTLSREGEFIDAVTYLPEASDVPLPTWRFELDVADLEDPVRPPAGGDVYDLKLTYPYGKSDVFLFSTRGERVDDATARTEAFDPYVVPNPYVGSASFEPGRFAISGRGERRVEFRELPARATIRIFTVRGDLVQTLHHDGSNEGILAWNLRTKDNLDLAPGLYVYQVDGGALGTKTGKFGVIK
jgi:hypothetical protein